MIRSLVLSIFALSLAGAPALAGNMEIQKKAYGGPNAKPATQTEKKGFILQNEAAQKVAPVEKKAGAAADDAAQKANMEIQKKAAAAQKVKSPRIGQESE